MDCRFKPNSQLWAEVFETTRRQVKGQLKQKTVEETSVLFGIFESPSHTAQIVFKFGTYLERLTDVFHYENEVDLHKFLVSSQNTCLSICLRFLISLLLHDLY